MRRAFIAGNWKMNHDVADTVKFIEGLNQVELDEEVDTCLCVPFIDLKTAVDMLVESPVTVGAQNMHDEESGAYTGEVSGPMLINMGVDYVVLGHSERREYFKEDDDFINRKVLAAFQHNLKPILCVGESLEEREANKQEDKVKTQLVKNLAGVTYEDLSNLVIAYEPIWAIGTGKTASAEDAERMCAFIRKELAEMFDEEGANLVRIQYGGSVKPENVKEIMSQENIDGALVGGASLDVESFASLVNFQK